MILKAHKFDLYGMDDYDGEEIKCGFCNHRTNTLYLLGKTREQALHDLKNMGDRELNGLCGYCFSDLLVDEGHGVLGEETIVNMFKELERLYQLLDETEGGISSQEERVIGFVQNKLINNTNRQNELTQEVNEEHPDL